MARLPKSIAALKPTVAQRKALEVLRRNHPRPVRESNATEFGGTEPRVYWQTARWLSANGLVVYPSGSTYMRLTDAGADFAARCAQ